MSVLSMVAFRMVTQEGLRKCLKIYEELKKNGSEEATTTSTTTMIPDTPDAKSSAYSRSAKRRIRRRKLQESRRGEGKIEMKKKEGEDTKESRESDNDDVDMTPYNLVTHANKRTEKDFLERSLMAAFLLRCLQRVGFFAHPTSDDGTYHRYFTLQRTSPFLLLSRAVFNLEIIGKNVLARAEDQLSIQQILRSRAMKP